MAVFPPLFLLFIMVTYSRWKRPSAQKVIDYACGSGADCTQIEQNGPCFQPNTVKNHCDVAVNSFYQKKVFTGATCDFNGAAFIPTSPPSNASSCLSSSSSTGTLTTGNSTTGMPTSSVFFPPNIMGPSGSTEQSGGQELLVRTTNFIVLMTIAALALRV